MSTTLEIILKTSGITEGVNAIKKLGDESQTAQAKIKTTTSTIDQVTKSSTSLGSKLKNIGSTFQSTIANVATFSLSVVNLQRSYRDLGAAQTAVDKSNLKLNKSQEALAKATAKVVQLQSQGKKGTAEYAQAVLDVEQAQKALAIATSNSSTAQKHFNDSQTDFWMGLVPTIVSSGGTLMGVLTEIGGTDGLGGLTSKLKGLGSGGFAGLSGLTAALGPLAVAALAAGVAFIAYDNAMKKVAEAKSEQTLAKNAKTLADELDHTKKSFDALKLKPGTNIIDFFSSLGPGGLQNTFVKMAEDAKTKEIELKTETEALTAAKEKLNKALADPALKSHVTAVADAAKKTVTLAQAEVTRLEAIEKTIPAVNKLSSSQAAANKAMGETTTLLDTMTKPFTGTSVFATAAQSVDQLKASFIALNQEADRSQFMKLLSGGNTSATTKQFGPFQGWLETMPEVKTTMEDVFESTRLAGGTAMTFISDAAKKTAEDEKAAALATKQAWDQAFTAQVSGIDKMIAAYDKLHPKEKGFSGLGQEKQFKDAQAQLDKLMSGAITKSPAFAKDFVTNFVTNVAKNMTPVAGQVFQPIIDFINTHKNDAPDVFMKGFQEVLGKTNTTLGGAMAGILDKNMVQPSATAAALAAGKISEGLAKVDVTPLEEKMKLGAIAAGLVTKGINKIPKKVTSTVNITANLAQANAKWNAFVRKVQMTTLQVKIAGTSVNIRKGSQAGAYGGPKASGYSGTVTRPTHFLVGEGGRPEDVYIKPRGSAGLGPSGGGFNGTINVYVDGVLKDARYNSTKFIGVQK